jgi:hypothetical protein
MAERTAACISSTSSAAQRAGRSAFTGRVGRCEGWHAQLGPTPL